MSRYKNSNYGKLAKYNMIRVNEDGSHAEDADDGTVLSQKIDDDGYRYVDSCWGKTAYINEAVMNGFRTRPKFIDDEGYIVEHIDGDITNCSKSNLRWKQMDPSKLTKTGHVFFEDYIIGKDGSIIVRDGKLEEEGQLRERWLDDDVNATWVFTNPIMVTYEVFGECLWHHPDEYMAKAGYVHGDKDSLKNPVVYHRDHDISNYNSDNLEWVESTDPRYIEYDEKRTQYQKDQIKRYNTDLGYSIPPSWPQ